MTLLNTPMPADKALKIIRSILESNSTVDLNAYCQFPKSCTNDPFKSHLFSVEDCNLFEEEYSDMLGELSIVVTKVSQTIPTYSIGDKALILSTGEMAEVKLIVIDSYGPIERNGVYIECEGENLYYHRSEICKLPNDL